MLQRDTLLDIIDELVDDISRLAADDGWKSLKSVMRARRVSKVGRSAMSDLARGPRETATLIDDATEKEDS